MGAAAPAPHLWRDHGPRFPADVSPPPTHHPPLASYPPAAHPFRLRHLVGLPRGRSCPAARWLTCAWFGGFSPRTLLRLSCWRAPLSSPPSVSSFQGRSFLRAGPRVARAPSSLVGRVLAEGAYASFLEVSSELSSASSFRGRVSHRAGPRAPRPAGSVETGWAAFRRGRLCALTESFSKLPLGLFARRPLRSRAETAIAEPSYPRPAGSANAWFGRSFAAGARASAERTSRPAASGLLSEAGSRLPAAVFLESSSELPSFGLSGSRPRFPPRGPSCPRLAGPFEPGSAALRRGRLRV